MPRDRLSSNQHGKEAALFGATDIQIFPSVPTVQVYREHTMSASAISRLSAGALIVVLGLVVGLTVWMNRQTNEHVNSYTKAHDVGNLYREAATQSTLAELHISIYDATVDDSWLMAQAEHTAALTQALTEIARSDSESDREFTLWVYKYVTPIADIFERLREVPPPPLDELIPDYLVAYGRLYDSLVAGALGDPTIADQLPAPVNLEGQANGTVNPITVVLGEMAVRREAEAAAALSALHRQADFQATLTPALFGIGAVLGVLSIASMFVHQRKATRVSTEADMLRRIATTDPLTGLGNVRGFEEAVSAVEAARGMHPVSMVMMDLDGFKAVNDSFGHSRGDEILRNFARVIGKEAMPGVSLFRVGGDEFALILHGHSNDVAIDLAERIRSNAETALGHGVTVSSGVASVATATEFDGNLLRQQADSALYASKLNGRNFVSRFDPVETGQHLFATAKLRAVRELLVEGRLTPVFQPIWDVECSAIIGYEALSRPHPDYGLDGPQEAFDIAEQFGHAADLDTLCRRHILEASSALPGDQSLFINLSPYTLAKHDFSTDVLLDELRGAGIAPQRVVFEITERSRVSTEVVVEGLRKMRSAGLRIALDDVGSGNNGLMLLGKSPFEFVKVDRDVIARATAGGPGRGALMAILAFASESGAQVIAEGIEDESMLDVVREFAHKEIKGDPTLIHAMQGFLVGRPQSAARLSPAAAA